MRLRSISLHVFTQSDLCTQLDTCKNGFRVASERDCSKLLRFTVCKNNANDINYEAEGGKQLRAEITGGKYLRLWFVLTIT